MQSSSMTTSSCTTSIATQKCSNFPTAAVAVIGLSCFVCTASLFFSAFTTNSEDAKSTDCLAGDSAGTSELYTTVIMLAVGYMSSLVAKRRHSAARFMHEKICFANEWLLMTTRRAASLAGNMSFGITKDMLPIVLAGVLCTICIVVLLVSAFTVEPNVGPSDDGLASESSTMMKAFTVGWMFMLSFKLRQELVGLLGSCCLLQPW